MVVINPLLQHSTITDLATHFPQVEGSPFQIGQRVRFIRDNDVPHNPPWGIAGIVVGIDTDGDIGVSFAGWDAGHNLNGLVADGPDCRSGWWCRPKWLEPFRKEPVEAPSAGGHPRFAELTADEVKLHATKNADYAAEGDPLGNFKRVSTILGMYPGFSVESPVGVALVYMLKQLDAALWLLAHNREGGVETVDTRLRDVHVYAKLARILYEERGDKDANP